MFHSIAIRDVPATTRLLADFWDASESIRGLIPRHFREEGGFEEQARLIQTRQYDRRTLGAVLREQNERFGAGPDVLQRIDQLEDPGSVVVIGGQQAGLFGGPLYTQHKVLTILALARRVEGRLGCPVVPVFWIASEDSDLAEVDHAHVIDREGRLRELRLTGTWQAKVPLSRVRLGEQIGPLMETLATLLQEGGYSQEVIDDLRHSYTSGRTYPQAFGAWMTRLFRGQGIVLVDPSEPRLKRLAHPLFDREIRDKSPVSAAVREQTTRLEKAGYPPQIELRDGYLTLFHQDPARDAITIRDSGFELKTSGKRFSRAELASLLEQSPDSFTPNAVLRPLFQDTLFPTLAVVLGPAEIAYFSQLTIAYQRMDIPMPLMVPRASLTIIESRVEKLRTRLGVSMQDILERGEHVINDILKRKIPASLTARIGEGRARVSGAWREIVGEIDALDPTLHRTAVLGSSRAMGQFDFMERKIAQAARKKNALLRDQVERLVAALAPRGGLQERTLCALPFLARHGTRILTLVAEAVDPFAAEHRALVVEP
ncbi:MAG: bacillithiol biosynthesis cysteine-adding enzyme BshC [Spirochaetia bacterium]|jgi:bacillithiol biosynthesis cysteine-adding enzyme BshC